MTKPFIFELIKIQFFQYGKLYYKNKTEKVLSNQNENVML